jgi:putative transposase
MRFHSVNLYHIYNQGNNRQQIFFTENNYKYFLEKANKYFSPFSKILAYCLMPNHFHFLIYYPVENKKFDNIPLPFPLLHPFCKSIGKMLSSYAQAINRQQNRSGSLFRQNTKSKCLTEVKTNQNPYPVTCFHYIHQNPLNAGLVNRLEDWPWSSFNDYANLRGMGYCDIDSGRKLLEIPENPRFFFRQSYSAIDPLLIQDLFS